MKRMVVRMINSLDLDPDGGDVDLLLEIEKAFGIKLAGEEVAACSTVGDLYDLIRAHSPGWEETEGTCASSVVFYRVRRALAADERVALSPGTPLNRPGISASRLFRSLRSDTGLRLPSLEPTRIGVTGAWIFLGGFLGGLGSLFGGAWIASGIGALVCGFGVLLIWVDPARLPKRMATIGDLVQRTVPLNAQVLAQVGARRPDRWSILVALAAEHGNLQPDEIGPESYLMRRGMELAMARR